MVKKILLGILALILLAVGGLLVLYQTTLYTAGAPHEGTRVITDARLLDGTGAEPVEPAKVVIRDDTIAAAGPAERIEAPDDAERVSANGMTVLPGLIDAHVHLGAPEVEEREDWEELSVVSIIWDSMRMTPDKRRSYIEHGVTAIKSAGDSDEWILRVRDMVSEGELEGPRLVAAGPSLTARGGHPAGTIYEGIDRLIETATRQIDEPSDARQKVAGVDELDADFVKAVLESGRRGSDREIPALAPRELEAVVDEAHERGLWVSLHWGASDEARTGLEAGVDALEHAGFEPMGDELARRIADGNVDFVPTLAVIEAVAPEALETAKANTARVHEADGRIVAGSDAANPGVGFGDGLHRELELLVEAGLEPMEALRASTAEAAEHLRLGDELGAVEAGRNADLVAVDGDPLDDISAIREIRWVFRDGRWVEGGP